MSEPDQQSAVEVQNRRVQRRTQRVLVEVAVLVYGHTPGKGPFQEETRTIQVSVHGGLITLATPVERGQRLILTNLITHEEQACYVAYVGKERGDRIEVGVGFTEAAPRDRKSTRLNSSHIQKSRMPSSA